MKKIILMTAMVLSLTMGRCYTLLAPPLPSVTQVHVSFQTGLAGPAAVTVIGQAEGIGAVSETLSVYPNQETYNLNYPFVSGTITWYYLPCSYSYSFTVQQGQYYVEDLYVFINTYEIE